MVFDWEHRADSRPQSGYEKRMARVRCRAGQSKAVATAHPASRCFSAVKIPAGQALAMEAVSTLICNYFREYCYGDG